MSKQARREGVKWDVPANDVESTEDTELDLYVTAYLRLDTERGEGHIPWTAVAKYAEYFGLDAEQAEQLFFSVLFIDNATTKERAKRNGQSTRPSQENAKSGGRRRGRGK